MKPEVMRAALAAGADMINDVHGLEAAGALAAVADSDCGLCVMHMRGMPAGMQHDPAYADVVAEVAGYLQQRQQAAQAAGIDSRRLLIDPGFGFGKTLVHNLALFKNLCQMADIAPVLVGVSRKSFLGSLTGRPTQDRLLPSVIAALLAMQGGAFVVRVHDVRETLEVMRLCQELTGHQLGVRQ
jgi:dihydropteroate synthase